MARNVFEVHITQYPVDGSKPIEAQAVHEALAKYFDTAAGLTVQRVEFTSEDAETNEFVGVN